jgi:cobyrinic acid a,c-diamide synthase
MRRLLLAACGSGSGKTLITSALLRLLYLQGVKVRPYKCGPDFIDPRFHEFACHVPGGNLDLFFSTQEEIRNRLARESEGFELSLIEGVMGYYDGIGAGSTRASASQLAAVTGTPSVLILDARGLSTTAIPLVKGMMEYESTTTLRGIFLNRVSDGYAASMKTMLEEATDLPVIGHLPVAKAAKVPERHLGLMLPEEISAFDDRLNELAELLRSRIDLDLLMRLASEAEQLECVPETSRLSPSERISEEDGQSPSERISEDKGRHEPSGICGSETESLKGTSIQEEDPENSVRQNDSSDPVTIGVACDEAFSFLYRENLEELERQGARLIRFSPLHDTALPAGISALLLPGGYPELYAKELAENESMRLEVRQGIGRGLPVFAECGGFLYLHRELEGSDGDFYPMCGVIDQRAWHTHRLTRFGYITLTEGLVFGRRTPPIRAHEFHHFESGDSGEAFLASKASGKRSWRCVHSAKNVFAGFPHLFLPSCPTVASAFLDAARAYQKAGHLQAAGKAGS